MWHSLLSIVHLVLFASVTLGHDHSFKSLSSSASDSGSSANAVDIYNVCPVMVKFTEEQELLSDDEIKAKAADAAMSAYMLSHPNKTLWDFFKIEHRQKRQMFKNLPTSEKFKRVFTRVVDLVSDTAIAAAHTIADTIQWVINVFRHPLVGMRQVIDFFKEFGKNIKLVSIMMWDDPKNTSLNMAGGFLLHVRHHPAEFTAETVLLVAGGSAVIHGLMRGVSAIFGGMSNVVSGAIMGALIFLHMIDEPILLVTPLITSLVETASTLGAGNSTEASLALTLDFIQPSNSCMIPEKFRPRISSRDLCLGSSQAVRMLLFGTVEHVVKMTPEERIAAYGRFHDFVCCFLTDHEFEVHAPNITATDFEADLVATPVKITDCNKLLGTYSYETMWKNAEGHHSM
uniref:Uncharacterized protein n=1 Tax=Peronospora matthiolae TaxID=2874970 RepID=A0AAV1T7V5_9STRA